MGEKNRDRISAPLEKKQRNTGQTLFPRQRSGDRRDMERDAQDAPVVVATLVHGPDGGGGRLPSVHTRSPLGALQLRHPLATQPVLSSAFGAPTQPVISSMDDVRISVDEVDFQDDETARAQIVSRQGTICKPATCNAPSRRDPCPSACNI